MGVLSKFHKIATFLVALIFTGGFVFYSSLIFKPSQSPNTEIFVLITLPLILGAVMSQKEYRFESLLFLVSSITMIMGYLIMFSYNDNNLQTWMGIIYMNIGAFFFCYGLIKLWFKSIGNLIDLIKKKEY